MVSVDEATDIILSHLYKPAKEAVALTQSVNRILGDTIKADRDFPPFDRVAMDGIAIQFERWAEGQTEFRIEDQQAAGMSQKRLDSSERCMEVMTGAILPEDTDTVIRYEDLDLRDDKATINILKVEKGQNIHRQGIDAREGSVLLERGLVISPAEVALLASVGIRDVPVLTFPKTAVISSGDELVEVSEVPEPYQIRKSNTYALEAAMEQMKWPANLYHLPDRKDFLLDSLRVIAADHDVLILSGGVSRGKFDFIPEVLEEIGVKKLFHQVSQRPGKPFWFGTSSRNKAVFALPGNPVSTYMCFYRFVKPWLMKSLGIEAPTAHAILAKNFSFQPPLTYFLQASVKNENGKLMAYPEAGGGSGDFANLKKVTGFLELPLEKNEFAAGETFPYFPFRLP